MAEGREKKLHIDPATSENSTAVLPLASEDYHSQIQNH